MAVRNMLAWAHGTRADVSALACRVACHRWWPVLHSSYACSEQRYLLSSLPCASPLRLSTACACVAALRRDVSLAKGRDAAESALPSADAALSTPHQLRRPPSGASRQHTRKRHCEWIAPRRSSSRSAGVALARRWTPATAPRGRSLTWSWTPVHTPSATWGCGSLASRTSGTMYRSRLSRLL